MGVSGTCGLVLGEESDTQVVGACDGMDGAARRGCWLLGEGLLEG